MTGIIDRNPRGGWYGASYEVSGKDADARYIVQTAYKYGRADDSIALYRGGRLIASASWDTETKRYTKKCV
jgi:hypothetical protein